MNRIFPKARHKNRRQAHCYRKAQALLRMASLHLREVRDFLPGDEPDGVKDLLARDVEDLLKEAWRWVRRGRRANVP